MLIGREVEIVSAIGRRDDIGKRGRMRGSVSSCVREIDNKR